MLFQYDLSELEEKGTGEEMDSHILARLDNIQDLPSLPQIVEKLTKIIEDPNASAGDVAKVMADDPAITAKILRLVNSAYYGRVGSGREITSVTYAIARMGFREVKNIVLSLSVFNLFPVRKPIIDLKNFWRHCISVAITTRVVHDFASPSLKQGGAVNVESLYVAGLLHDIGILVLNQYFRDDMERIVSLAKESDTPLHLMEQRILKTDHAKIGAYLARRWDLPKSIVKVIELHHEPEEAQGEDTQPVQIVNLADFICTLHWPEDNAEGPQGDSHLYSLKALGIPIKNLSEILDVVEEEASRSETLVTLG